MANTHTRHYNYPLFLLAISYTLITVSATGLGIYCMSLALKFKLTMLVLYLTAWLPTALTAGYWYVPLAILFEKNRRPIREETETIDRALLILNQQIPFRWQPKMWIQDNPLINASCFGGRSVVISTGLLTSLSVEEIAAVLAHERGHQLSKDTMAGASISVNFDVIRGWIFVGKYISQLLKRLNLTRCVLLIIVVLVLYWFRYPAPLLILAACIVPAIALTILKKIMSPVSLWISRRTEYRQDAYAHQIGLGQHLRAALLKIAELQPSEPISRWQVTFRRTHPLTHDRIRRLDELAGWKTN
jgi:heat shock protein HtpX